MSTPRLLDAWMEDPESASQAGLQQLAWYPVPHRSGEPQADIAEACARILGSTGRPCAAAAMRRHSPEVLDAWTRSPSAGFEAFVAANDATGVTPPDTPELTWAAMFGGDEAAVVSAAERALERAVEDRGLVPGGRSWRGRQREIMAAWLAAPVPELDGAVPVDMVHAERREFWLRAGPPDRAAVLRRALQVVEPPPDAPPPLQALLDVAVEPIPLTAAHRVPPRIVGPLDEWFGWTFPGMPGRSESHVPQFVTLRAFAAGAGLLARRGRELRLTVRGRALQPDPVGLGAIAATAWFGGDEFGASVAEVAAAVLLAGPASVDTIVEVAARTVAPSFRTENGDTPDHRDLRDACYRWVRPGSTLGWLAHAHGLGSEVLTEAGRRAACAGLIERSQAPRGA